MKIIVVGGEGRNGPLSFSLVAENHDVILIEKTNPFLTILPNGLISFGILGNGANFKILSQVDVEDCDLHFHDQYDEVNMVSAVLAKMGAKRDYRSGAGQTIQFLLQEKNIMGFS